MVRRAASMSATVMLMPHLIPAADAVRLAPACGASALHPGAARRIPDTRPSFSFGFISQMACLRCKDHLCCIRRVESEHSKDRQRGHLAMTEGGPRKIGVSIEVKPHAYDPTANPEL